MLGDLAKRSFPRAYYYLRDGWELMGQVEVLARQWFKQFKGLTALDRLLIILLQKFSDNREAVVRTIQQLARRVFRHSARRVWVELWGRGDGLAEDGLSQERDAGVERTTAKT